MRLKVGQVAPEFALNDVMGQRVALSAYRGTTVLLSFHRGAVCPLCNIRLKLLIDRYDEYQRRGLRSIAFFESSPARIHHYLDRLRAPFPVVADPERRIYARYGLESSLWGVFRAWVGRRPDYREAAQLKVGGGLFAQMVEQGAGIGQMPADFLIGPDGRIRVAYYGKDAGDFLLFSELEAAVAQASVR